MKHFAVLILISSMLFAIGCSKTCPECNGTGKVTTTEKIPLPYEVTNVNIRPNFDYYGYPIFSPVKASITIRNDGDHDGIFMIFFNAYLDNKIVHTEKSQIAIRAHTSNTQVVEFIPNSLMTKVKYRISPAFFDKETTTECELCNGTGKISKGFSLSGIFKRSKRTNGYDDIKGRTEEFYNAMIAGDKKQLLTIYDFPMARYFSKENASREFVKQDIDYYFSRWSARVANLLSCEILEKYSTQDVVRSKIEYEFYFTDNYGKMLTGKSTTILTWEKSDNEWKIVATTEEVQE
jgi:hypothetical protein